MNTEAIPLSRAVQRRHEFLLSLGWILTHAANDWWTSPHTGHQHCSEVAEKLERDRAGHKPETFTPMFDESDPMCINNMGSPEIRKPGKPNVYRGLTDEEIRALRSANDRASYARRRRARMGQPPEEIQG